MDTEEIMSQFIESKGLMDEYRQFEKQKEAEELEELKNTPIGQLWFDFSGHYSKRCYELSGEDFYKSGTLNDVLYNFFDEFDYVDPATADDDMKEGLKPIKEILDEVDFQDLFGSFMEFINGEGDTFSQYLCDDFGFASYEPSRKELEEWFGSLLYDPEKADDLKEIDFQRSF